MSRFRETNALLEDFAVVVKCVLLEAEASATECQDYLRGLKTGGFSFQQDAFDHYRFCAPLEFPK